MYTTCLFCSGHLGKNEAVEHFPVGRRLAFDAAKGRLWVVCRKCERWNLTPLEERWEAIEECERAFRDTKLRVSTDQVGLARLREGLELVRIGEPQRPEMAAWRYGDQFGRRRKKRMIMLGAGAVVVGAVIVAGPVMGLVGAGSMNLLNFVSAGRSAIRSRTKVSVPLDDGTRLETNLNHLARVEFRAEGAELMLKVPGTSAGAGGSYWRFRSSSAGQELHGEDAIRVAAALLPLANLGGGSGKDVRQAVDYIEAAGSRERLIRQAAGSLREAEQKKMILGTPKSLLVNIPTPGRLALEMMLHEESERRALEGELHVLEAAWRDAEEIAGIADNMFLPPSVDVALARLKKKRDS